MTSRIMLGLLLTAGIARAASLSHTGYLVGPDDQPVSGVVAMTFRLYAQPTAAVEQPLWASLPCEVTVIQGRFSVVLGQNCVGASPLAASALPDTAPRYLEAEVAGVRLAPRLTLTSVPSAQVSDTSRDTQQLIARLGSTGTLNDAANPVEWSQLRGVPASLADGVDADTLYTAGDGLTLSGTRLSVGPAQITPAMLTPSGVAAGTYPAATITVDAHGRVTAASAGNPLPPAESVVPSMLMNDAGGLSRVTGGLASVSSGSLTIGAASMPVTVSADGNLGVGTSSPQRKLHVSADSSGSPTLLAVENTNTTDGNAAVLSFRTTTTGSGGASFVEHAGLQAKFVSHAHGTRSSRLGFFNTSAGVVSEQLTLGSGGGVGIPPLGASNWEPLDRLQVAPDDRSPAGLGEFEGANLIFNGGAESDSAGWTAVDTGVDPSSGGSSISSDLIQVFDGQRSFYMNNDGGWKQTVSLVPGAVYTLSGRSRVSIANSPDASTSLLFAQTVGGTRDLVDDICNIDVFDQGTTLNQWRLCSVTFKAPAANGQKRVSVEVGMRSAGNTHSVLWDDLRLAKGGLVGGYSSVATRGNTTVIGGRVGIGTDNPQFPLQVEGGMSTQGTRHQRDILTFNTTVGSSNPIHIKTNWTLDAYAMYRFVVEGYNYGAAAAINSDCVGYLYRPSGAIISRQCNNYAGGVSFDQYLSSDGYLVLKVTPSGSSYFIGFTLHVQRFNPSLGPDLQVSPAVQQASNL